jgi:hypothetical protein
MWKNINYTKSLSTSIARKMLTILEFLFRIYHFHMFVILFVNMHYYFQNLIRFVSTLQPWPSKSQPRERWVMAIIILILSRQKLSPIIKYNTIYLLSIL